MPEPEEPQLSSADREALETGRTVLWLKTHWQFLALAGLIGGPNAVNLLTGKEADKPGQDVRLAVVETKLQTLGEQVAQMNAKLDRALRRRDDDNGASLPTPASLASIMNGDVSRAVRLEPTPTLGPFRPVP